MKTNAARGDGVVLTCCCRAPGCSASSRLLDLYLAVSGSDPSGFQRSPPSGTADELQPSRSAAHRLVRGLPGPAPAALYLRLGPAPDPAGLNTDQTQADLYPVSSSVPPTLVYRSLAPSDPGFISGWLGFRPRPASTSDSLAQSLALSGLTLSLLRGVKTIRRSFYFRFGPHTGKQPPSDTHQI